MSVLLTGATGFLGSHLAFRLAQQDAEVDVVVRADSAIPFWWGKAASRIRVHRHSGSTEHMIEILKIVRPDIVYHCATHFVAEHEPQHLELLVQSNVLFGTQLLEAMEKTGVRRLVNTGTFWQHKEDGNFPISLYAATKQAFEAVLDYFVDAHKFDVVTLKLYDGYGPHDRRRKLIPTLLEIAHRPRKIEMSPGHQLIDLVFVDDIIAALQVGAKRLKNRDASLHERFAVRSGSLLSLRDVVATFEKVSDAKITVAWGARPYRNREVMVPWAGEVLPDWSPRVGLEEGLRRTVESYRTEPVLSFGGRRKLISYVAPCFNEKENIRPLCQRISNLYPQSTEFDVEIILVENGSSDNSDELIRDLHRSDPRIKMLKLSRNFGYSGAISAGLQHARGDWIVILDGDQQDPPELVPAMIEKALEGFDVVYGVRTKRHGSRLKSFLYGWFYRLYRLMADIDVPLDAGEFCVMRRSVVDAINDMPERQRFVRGLRAWVGFRQTGFPYVRDARAEGGTKFRLRSMINLGLDGLLSFSVLPLRLTLIAGVITAALSILLGLAQGLIQLAKWAGMTGLVLVLPPGLTQTNIIMTFLFGITISCLGVVGEYVGRIYSEVKRRPLFLVEEKLF